MDASFYTNIPLAPGSDQTLRKQVTAFKLWDSSYTVGPLLCTSPPLAGQMAWSSHSLWLRHCLQKAVCRVEICDMKINMLNHSSSALGPARRGLREPTLCISSQPCVPITSIA